MTYKFSNPEHTKVKNLTSGVTGIYPGVYQWQEYRQWVEAGGITETFDTRTPEEIAAQEQIVTAVVQRLNEIEAAKIESGIDKYTPEQVRNYISNEIDKAGTMVEVKAAVKGILIKMAIYILR